MLTFRVVQFCFINNFNVLVLFITICAFCPEMDDEIKGAIINIQ